MKRDGARNSLWQDTTADYNSKSMAEPGQQFDVVIAGGGITGISTGLLLQKAGKSVMIAEAQSPGFGTTGGTTAHLNTFMDTPYNSMQKKFGEKDARLVAQSIRDGLGLIHNNVEKFKINCGYKKQPGYLFSQNPDQTKELEDIYNASRECGVKVEWSESIPLPLPFEKSIIFPGQASFHPGRYLVALAKEFESAGGIILNNCRVTTVDEGEFHTIQTSRGGFKSKDFIYATHIPPGVNLLHFRCAPYRSYVLTVKLSNREDYPDALVYDMHDPYHYYRTQEIDGELYFIAGGEDHKTGHLENSENCFRKLHSHLLQYFPIKEIVNNWSSQYFEPADGLPYIGRLPGDGEHMFVATGYGGNGMTYSAVAALTLTGMIMDGHSNYEEIFDPNRIKLVAGFNNFVKEAADVVGKIIGKFIPADKLPGLADLAPGEARVVKFEDHRLAIYKDENGEIYSLNSACTHIKCDVSWNDAEKTWDCPCHGSRFSYTGEMLTAPARKDLEKVTVRAPEEIS